MKNILSVILCLGILLCSCQEELPDKLYITTDQQQISAYIESRVDLTMTTRLVERSGYFNLLNSYGSYTMFAPTDEAWNKYLTSLGKSSIDDLTEDECMALFDFHVLYSGVNLKAQNTGLLSRADTTMSGVLHFVDLTDGINNVVMNKTSRVTGTSELPNGWVYTMSEVFTPRPSNIYDYLVTAGYSIFAQAIEAIGMKDTLQTLRARYKDSKVTFTPFYTLFAEPDDVFKNAGINNVEQLAEAVWAQDEGRYTSAQEALEAFVQYHIIWNLGTNQKLTTNLIKTENLRTMAEGMSRVIGVDASDLLKPDPLLNGSVKLNPVKADVAFKNGIVHELNSILYVKHDPKLCDYILECEDTFRAWTMAVVAGNFNDDIFEFQYYDVQYDTKRCLLPGIVSNTSFSSSYYDVSKIGYAYSAVPTERGYWVDFYLRNLPVGKYEIYLNYRRIKNTTSQKVNAYFRKASEVYDWKTQLLYSNLDMAFDNSSAEDDRKGVYPEFNQNILLGQTEVTEYGDYVVRFVHVDNRVAYYDNIILKPVQ